MATRKKILIGGLGALTPIIMNLLVVDFNVLFMQITAFSVLGYFIRVIVLFYLGGLVAFLHKDEKSPVKIFELGIVAPALITALINANNVEVPKIQSGNSQAEFGTHFFISSVYAQTDQKVKPINENLKVFSLPEESTWKQLLRGLTGSKPKRVWFVVTGEFLALEEARQQAEKINKLEKDYIAEVYKPYGEDPYYRVVIGANLLLKSAQVLRRKAVAEGLPKETHLWTFPK